MSDVQDSLEFVCVEDYEHHAKAILDEAVWSYFGTGAANGIAMSENALAWQRLRLRPRVMQKIQQGHTRVKILNRILDHPIILAPVAYQKIVNPLGELASSLAAAALGAGYVLSGQSSTGMEVVSDQVQKISERGPLWFQMYWQHDRKVMRELVDRIHKSGYEAIVLTVDAPVNGVRDQQRRTKFKIPKDIRAVDFPNVSSSSADPVVQATRKSAFEFAQSTYLDWNDIKWLLDQTQLPVILKGILHPDDAKLAQQVGVAGVIVSNHGGRVLDAAISTCTALSDIRCAVGDDYLLLVDGGIKRGTDILKAICLGANAVLIGKPYIMGLACAGAQGVAHVIRLLQDELEIAMVLSGCASLENIPRDLIAQSQVCSH